MVKKIDQRTSVQRTSFQQECSERVFRTSVQNECSERFLKNENIRKCFNVYILFLFPDSIKNCQIFENFTDTD